jgi:hypothetical protein
MDSCPPCAWNGSWDDAQNNPSAAGAVSAIACVIGAASACAACEHTSCKRQVSGSNPLTGSQVRGGVYPHCDIDLDRGLVHVAFNYVVRGGQRVRKDTKTHQDRWLAIDPDTCALIATYLDEIRAALAAVGVELRDDAYVFSNDPAHARPWNPDWATHKVAEAAEAAGVKLDIKGGRHYTASQLLAGGFDLRNTAARPGHSGGGATTLRHYAEPVPEVDRRAAAYLAQLTARSAPSSPQP